MEEPSQDLTRRLVTALDAAAAGRIDRLLHEARAAAEDEVRALVQSAMTAALLRRTVERLEGAAPDVEAPAAERPPLQSEQGWYIYGVVAADHPGLPEGLAGMDGSAPVRLFRAGNLQVLTSPVPLAEFQSAIGRDAPDLDWVDAKARAHDEILVRALEGGPVVPLRFGTILRTTADVAKLLDRHAAALEELLASLAGKSEWGVKFLRRPAGGEKPKDRPRTGTDYLKGRQRQHARRNESGRRQRAVVEAGQERLRKLSADAVAAPARAAADGEPAVVASDFYLVSDAGLDRFRAEVRALSAEAVAEGLDVRLTGPWPAYHFARLDLTPEPAA